MDKLRRAYVIMLLMLALFYVAVRTMILLLGEEYGVMAVACYVVVFAVYGLHIVNSDCPFAVIVFLRRAFGVVFFLIPFLLHAFTVAQSFSAKRKKKRTGTILTRH